MRRLWLIGSTLLLQSWMTLAQAPAPSAPGSSGRMDDTFEITLVRVVSGHPEFGAPRQRLALGRTPAPISATFLAKGSGQVSGHWELATPSDGAPTATDLTPTPRLTASARLSQRRFRQLGTFSFSLSPGERYVIHGPVIDAQSLSQIGRYHVVLRLDAVSSISAATPKMPAQIAPVILEVKSDENKN